MTDTAADAPRTDRPRRAPKVGGQGQWALGEPQPLNANERFKQEDDAPQRPRPHRGHLQPQGFASITTDDLHGRFRWWGLYTQRKPGHRRRQDRLAGAARARGRVLHAARPHRRRRPHAPSSCASSATSPATTPATPPTSPTGRTSSCTGSGSRTCPRSGERLEAVGLLTDRGLRRLPARHPRQPGRRHRRRRDHRPDAGDRGDPAPLHRRPRPSPTCRASSSPRSPACSTNDVVHEINDISFVGVEHPELGPGYDLWVGGGLSTNPRLAERLGVFVGRGRRARRVGRRRLDLPRLRLPPAAPQGPAEVPARRLGPGEVPRGARDRVPRARRCPTARRPRPPTDRGDHVGVHEQKDGRYYVGAAPVVGRISGDAADRLADLVEAHGSHAGAAHPAPEAARPRRRSRTASTPLVAGAARRSGSRPTAGSFRRHTMACTGIEYCKLAIVETKATATRTVGRARGPARRRRRPDRRPAVDPRQRLPQLLRPHPGRRHRAQGPDRHRRRRRPGRGLPGPPRRRARARRRASAARCAASRSRPSELPDYVERVVRTLRRPTASRASGSPPGPSAPTRRLLV